MAVNEIKTVEIEIDGITLTAKANQTVIQVADEANIYIPRFCYHPHLSIPANCRMCLVEMEKSPKAVPACATPVMAGMKIFTKSQKTLLAQRAVMEFLLVNHPLDCPICDQGGECELQDISMGYGSSASNYDECKRAVADENLGPLIATEMTRCILCTRCIRFGDEIAGLRELGMTFRGEHEEVTTFVEQAMRSEVSGNIIDLCPVGALTSKPYRFTARAWELIQHAGVSPHDCLGSNLNIHTRNGKVMRVVSRENAAINQTWIADRDRFSYAGLYHSDRLEKPRVKIDGIWQTVEWQYAFQVAADKLQAVIDQDANQLGALASPNSTLEEFYLLQKIMRGLGSENIDHRLRESDMQDQDAMPVFPGLGMPIAELEQCDAVLLIGCNLQKEQPLAALRLRQAIKKGGQVFAVNPIDYDFNFKVTAKKIIAPYQTVSTLKAILQVLEAQTGNEVDESITLIAQQLRDKKQSLILLGALAANDNQASVIRYLAKKIATLSGARLSFMTSGANAAGAWLAGAIPHRQAGGKAVSAAGLNAYAMIKNPRKAYLLLNVEPELDFANASLSSQALQQASCVIALSQYSNDVLQEHADVILPIAAFTETSGTYINASGDWQSFNGVANTYGEARPAWKVLRVLANFLNLKDFDYESSEQIKHEVVNLIEIHSVKPLEFSPDYSEAKTGKLSRIGEIPLYALDSLVRRSQPLQAAQIVMEGESIVVKIHEETAKQLHITDGDIVSVKQEGSCLDLPVMIDNRIAVNAAWIAGGIPATRDLGDLFGEIEIDVLQNKQDDIACIASN